MSIRRDSPVLPRTPLASVDLDDAILVSDQEAHEETLRLNRAGFPVGPSSGTNMTVARRLAAGGKIVLTFFPDRMDRYRSLPEFKDL